MGKYDLTEDVAVDATPEPGEFSKGLRAGAYGAGSQLNSLAGLVGENLGFDEFAKGRNDAAGQLQAKAQENAPRIGSYKQVTDLRSGADYVTGLIGGSVPIMGAGIVGGIAGGLTGGKAGVVRGMLGSATATAPFEIGGVIQKQQADPEAMQATAGARLRDAAVSGAASAGAQSLVPGLVGRQILGKAAGSVGKQSVAGIVGQNAMDIPLEGLTEGTGEAIKQYGANQNKPLDWDAIKENAVGGAAAGSAFGAVGAGADLAHSRAGGVAAGLGDAVGSARTSINERLAKARGVAGDAAGAGDAVGSAAAAADAVPKKFASVADDIGAFFQSGKTGAEDIINRVASGQPLGDLAEFASAQGDRAREMMDFSDVESLKKAQAWADEMLNDAGLTPERRQAVADAAQNIAEPTGRAAMAGLRKAWGAGQDALGKVQALHESFGQRGPGGVSGIKKSEDYSGANQAIAAQLGPLLERSQPELAGNPQGMAVLADGLRQAVEALPGNHLSSDTAFRLIDSLGADTVATLDKAYQAVGDKDPAKAESFYKRLNEMADLQQRSTSLRDFIGGALTEKSQGLIKASQLGELVQALVSHARGDNADPNAGPHQRTAQDRQFRELIAEHFGDKADAVSLAIEKEAGIRMKQETAKEGDVNADGDVVTAESLDVIRKGRGKNNDAVMHPDLFTANRESGQNYGAQYMADLQRENPGHNVRFEYEEGSRTHGHAVAEKAADPEALSAADVQGMRLDTKKYPKSKDRIEVGDLILDTRRIAKTMDRKLEYSQADEQSRAHRMARMFTEGLARLVEQHGNFDVPDTAVIGQVGGRDLTFGDAKALRSDTSENRMSKDGQEKLKLLRRDFKTADAEQRIEILADVQKLHDFEKARELSVDQDNPTSARAQAMKRLEANHEKHRVNAAAYHDGPVKTDMGKYPFEENDAAFDKDGNLTKEGALDLLQGDADGGVNVKDQAARGREQRNFAAEGRGLVGQEAVREQARRNAGYERNPVMYGEGEGRTEIGKDEQIHRVASTLGDGDALYAGGNSKTEKLTGKDMMKDRRSTNGPGDIVNKSNMDGSGHSHNASDRSSEPRNNLVAAISDWGQTSSAPAKVIAARAKVLLGSFDKMSANDRRRFADLGGKAAEGKYPATKPASAAEASSLINALAKKYVDVIVPPKGEALSKAKISADGGKPLPKAAEPGAPKTVAAEPEKQAAPAKTSIMAKLVDKAVLSGEFPDTPAGVERFLSAAGRRYAELGADMNSDASDHDKKIYGALYQMFAPTSDLRMMFKELDTFRELPRDEQLRLYALADSMSTDRQVAKGDTPGPKSVAAKKAAFLERAASGERALLKELSTSDDAKGLQRAAEVLESRHSAESSSWGRVVDAAIKVELSASTGETGGTVRSLTSIIMKLSDDPAYIALSKAVTKVAGDVRVSSQNLTSQRGTYNSRTDWIVIANNKPGTTQTLLHEAVHAATVKALDADLNLRKIGSGLLGYAAHRDASIKAHLGKDNVYEFIAEVFTNKELQEKLRAIPALDLAQRDIGALETAWDSFVALISKALGLDAAHATLLGQAIEWGSAVMRSQAEITNRLNVADAVNARLGELVQDPDVAYGLQTKKYSAQATGPGATQTANSRANVEAHIEKVLGKSVKVAWASLTHAGEFQRMRLNDIIRLSVHALDPMSTAYHESLHAFFAQLKDAKAHDITQVLEKAAASEHVMAQLTERFKDEPAVLAQLKDPEERAAYMYQMWASDPNFKVSISAKGVFGKIAEFIRKTLGIWSNDDRALHIMEYFNSGEYANSMGSPSVVRAALMSSGRNQAIEAARSMAKPLTNLADAVASSGTARLRDTGNSALNELADLIKREATDASGKDQGYIAAARVERTKRLNDLGAALEGYTPEQLQEAMIGLQNNKPAASPEARLAVRAIKAMLRDAHGYMVKAGVEIGDLGPDYFPRVWDSHYISKHQTEFKDMLEPYVRSGQFKGSVDEFIRQLGVREGNEFGIESRMPGMQFKKERLLAFIKPEDAAMFVNKDLFATLGSYISQATRRAEWNRRMGEGKLEALFERAKAEGATPEQLKLADNYLKGVDGTLGDGMNPTLRRLSGNMIVYQNVRLLPLAMFSSIVDPVGVMVRGGTMKDAWNTFKRGVREVPESFGREASSDEGAQMAELVGVIDSAVLSSTLGDMYTQGMVGGTAQKINNAFFKWNLMEGMNRSFRIGATEAAVSFIGRHANGSTSAHSKRWIGELGLQAGDVKATPGGRIALTEADGLTAAQVTRVHAAINQWVDGAVLRPDAADKPVWMNDPRFALISHLKQFVYSFQKTILGRVVHEFEQGNYVPAMALASYVPVMLAADFAKGLLQGGGDQPEWKKGWGMEDYLGYSVQRAGLLGVSQFGYDMSVDVQRGGVGVGALVGPTIEQFSDAVQLLGGHKQFGPMLLKAMPANALYAHSLGGADNPDPMFVE